jgi:WXG100 family type VII secretion target
MADQIKMDFKMMEAMAKAFGDGMQTLEDVLSEVSGIASMLKEGALIGDAGEAFITACREPLSRSISGLRDKFEELQKDINSAVEEMRAAEKSAKERVS